jgi:CubicO group peptidase (beta-lactamase class C family)
MARAWAILLEPARPGSRRQESSEPLKVEVVIEVSRGSFLRRGSRGIRRRRTNYREVRCARTAGAAELGLGFHLTLADVPGMRSTGTGDWAGVFNSYYWIDRSKGIGGVLCSRQQPFVAERPQCNPDLTLKSVRWSTLDGQLLPVANGSFGAA